MDAGVDEVELGSAVRGLGLDIKADVAAADFRIRESIVDSR